MSQFISPIPTELKEIILTAQKNNSLFGITGALCLLDGSYVQYVEGEARNIDTLSKKLIEDPRHKNFKMLVHEPISVRQFPKWKVALLTWDDQTKSIFRRFYPTGSFEAQSLDSSRVVSLFSAWSLSSNWMNIGVD